MGTGSEGHYGEWGPALQDRGIPWVPCVKVAWPGVPQEPSPPSSAERVPPCSGRGGSHRTQQVQPPGGGEQAGASCSVTLGAFSPAHGLSLGWWPKEGPASPTSLNRRYPASPLIRDQKSGRFCSGQKWPKILICGIGVGWGPGLHQTASPKQLGQVSPGSGGAWPHLDTVFGEKKEQPGWLQVAVSWARDHEDSRNRVGMQCPQNLMATGAGESLEPQVPS